MVRAASFGRVNVVSELCLLAEFVFVFVGHQAVARRILQMDTGLSPFQPGEDAVGVLQEIISDQMPQGWFKLLQMAREGEAL